MYMKSGFSPHGLRHTTSSRSCHALLLVGRIVVASIVLLNILMPLTQSIWDWDHFLRGGPDFEFTLLSVLIFLGLVAFFAHQAATSRSLDALITLSSNAAFLLSTLSFARFSVSSASIQVDKPDPVPNTVLATTSTPLRI